MTATADRPVPLEVEPGRHAQPGSIVGWLASTDHKRIGLLTLGTALVLMLVAGGLALTIRGQLAQPQLHVLTTDRYDQFFNIHGSL
jgi:cytochrome c oxidase subunit 1